jgi:corrinoid protein of di/trimethylamine methyltransferase
MSSKEEILEKLSEAVITGHKDQAVDFSKKALETGVDPLEAINQGLTKGMGVVGDRYADREIYLPEVLIAADAMYAGLDILTPAISAAQAGEIKKVVIGTVEGDIHDIGKNIVKTMLIASGFSVTDLGRDVPVTDFIKTSKDINTDFVAMSTLMTPTMESMKRVIDGLKEEGIREGKYIMVGGAPISEDFCRDIGADIYADYAEEAALKAKAVS